MPRKYLKGFTLIELMITLALVAGLLAFAAPSMGDWMQKSHQRNLAKALHNALTMSRSEAIKRNMRVNICVSADQRTCAQNGGWEQGWIIYADANDSRTLEVNDAIVHHESGAVFLNVTATGNGTMSTYASFIGNGISQELGGGFQAGTFTVCAPGQNAILVIMAKGGRVRIASAQTPC